MKIKINHLAVWIIVILAQIIPFVWYTIFSEQWLSLNNLTEEQAMGLGNHAYIVSIIDSIVLTYIIAWLFARLGIDNALDGLKTSFIIGFSVCILSPMTVNLFSLRPYALSWIDGGVQLLIWVIAGIILGMWVKKVEK